MLWTMTPKEKILIRMNEITHVLTRQLTIAWNFPTHWKVLSQLAPIYFSRTEVVFRVIPTLSAGSILHENQVDDALIFKLRKACSLSTHPLSQPVLLLKCRTYADEFENMLEQLDTELSLLGAVTCSCVMVDAEPSALQYWFCVSCVNFRRRKFQKDFPLTVPF